MKHALTTRNAKSTAFAYSPDETRSRGSGILALATASIALVASLATAEAQQLETSGAISCDDGLMASIAEIPDTEALLVKSFRKGEQLLLDPDGGSGAQVVEAGPNATVPVAGTDLCLVKLLVGPGNPGPEGSPSTSAGIGIEVLLPAPDFWNERIRAYGNSGWSGTPQASLSVIASDDLHAAAAAKGFVVATSDNGHVASVIDPSFAMNPDGSINTVGWKALSGCFAWTDKLPPATAHAHSSVV